MSLVLGAVGRAFVWSPGPFLLHVWRWGSGTRGSGATTGRSPRIQRLYNRHKIRDKAAQTEASRPVINVLDADMEHRIVETGVVCLGCGATLQATQPNVLGYCPVLPSSRPRTSSEKRAARQQPSTLCQRCYLIQHRNRVTPAAVSCEDFASELSGPLHARLKNSLVLHVVDLFDFHGSFVPQFKDILRRAHTVLVGNKIDLLPQTTNIQRVKQWMKHEAKLLGVDRIKAAHVVSSTKGWGVNSLAKDVEELRAGRDVFVLGCTNVGKSTLVNQLIQRYGACHRRAFREGKTDDEVRVDADGRVSLPPRARMSGTEREVSGEEAEALETEGYRVLIGPMKAYRRRRARQIPVVTTSKIPGTTLQLIGFPLGHGVVLPSRRNSTKEDDATITTPKDPQAFLFDTPGVFNPAQVLHRLTEKDVKLVVPSRPIKPVTYRLIKGQSLLLGGLARLDLLLGRPMMFACFVSGDVGIHITKTNRADPQMETHTGDILFPPTNLATREKLLPFETATLRLHGEGWKRTFVDIVIPGLGWVAVLGPGDADVRVLTPHGTKAVVRESLLPYDARNVVRYQGKTATRW